MGLEVRGTHMVRRNDRIITFKNAVIKGYMPDSSGKTEQWTATGYDAADIKRQSIGKPRP